MGNKSKKMELSDKVGHQLSLFPEHEESDSFDEGRNDKNYSSGKIISMKDYQKKSEWASFYERVSKRVAHLMVYDEPEENKSG